MVLIMEENKSLQVRKEGIFTKFLNFFRNLFKSNKPKYTQMDIHLDKEPVENIITPVEKKDFKEEMRVEIEKDGTLELQKQFEENESSVENMTEEEVNKLIMLYKDQVSILRETINIKRNELEKRLNNYSENI